MSALVAALEQERDALLARLGGRQVRDSIARRRGWRVSLDNRGKASLTYLEDTNPPATPAIVEPATTQTP